MRAAQQLCSPRKCHAVMSSALVLVLVYTGWMPAAAEDNGSLHQEAKIGESIGKPKCIDISGTYEMLGKALPSMPEYYIVKAIPLTLDAMLEQDLPVDQRNVVTRVKLLKSNQAIRVFFWANDRLVKHVEIPMTAFTSCDVSSLTIFRSGHSNAEGTSTTVKAVTRISQEKDGALQIIVSRSGQGRGLIFFPFTWHEEYGARFAKVPDDGISTGETRH
jgi:hypothetical protein